MEESLTATTVGDIVAGDFRAASVLERHGIDFCCGGRRSLAEACRVAAVDPTVVERELHALPDAVPDDGGDVRTWPLDRLADFIVVTHHEYTRFALDSIGRYLKKLVEVHGARHPELARIEEAWRELSRDMLQHMMKEEHVLFPYIRELVSARGPVPSPFGTVANPIKMMEREHQDAGDELRLIRELSHGYTVPADGCTTYRICFEELARFELDLHRHVHLENNVLFPRAIEMERGG